MIKNYDIICLYIKNSIRGNQVKNLVPSYVYVMIIENEKKMNQNYALNKT